MLTWTQSPFPTFSLRALTLMPQALIVRSAQASLALSSIYSIQGESNRHIGHPGGLAIGHVASSVLGQLTSTLANRGLRGDHQPLQPVHFAAHTKAESVLKSVSKKSPAYPQARRLLTFLTFIVPLDDQLAPPTSILREFLGGSAFEY